MAESSPMVSDHGRKMRIGLAGLGSASIRILDALQGHPNYEVAGGCDLREEARAAFEREHGFAAKSSVAELAADPNLDAVYIATPNYLHCEQVVEAAGHGKQIIVEKPMALTLDECDRMIAAADAAGVRLLAGHTHSFDAPIAAMMDQVDRGLVGDVYMINNWYYTDWMFRGRMAEELENVKGGGVVFRQGPHGIDIARLFGGGMVRQVYARTTAHDPRHPTEGSYVAMLDFANGVTATVVFSGYAYFDSSELTYGIGENGCPRDPGTHRERRHRVLGFADMAEEEQYKNSRRYGGSRADQSFDFGGWCPEDARKHPFYGLTVVSGTEGDLRQTPDGVVRYGNAGPVQIPVRRGALEREAELNVLYDAWAADEPLREHDGRWGKATLEVCLAILESSRTGTAVTCRHQVPSYQRAVVR